MFLVVLVLSMAAIILADTWSFPICISDDGTVVKEPPKIYTFGDTRIELECDTTKSGNYLEFLLRIYDSNNLMAMYRNVAFEDIYASEDNSFFVGLSNCGIPGTAFVVFDKNGRLLREVKHQFLHASYSDYDRVYSNQSVTLVREWYDKNNVDIQFQIDQGRLEDVVLKGSTGLEYRLLHQIYRYGQRLEPMMRKLKAVEELTKKGLSQSEALEMGYFQGQAST
jgi:hypothetical protein